ncbi:MAG: NigD-like N-terminal domain-containing protein [Prolixibacteraceae bacterium]|nr:NigD-like N-terminal domain-containing protein [Prolixibacteraceae bacterium]MBN2773532.1 NigD-like N-terminal domain-containing protein [Prolixibacteraceae bacterium]
MKRILRITIVIIIGLSLFSCNLDDDGYSLTNMWVSFGILYENDNAGMGYSIKLDNEDALFPLASNIYLGQFDDTCRVLVNYTILGDISDTVDYNQYYVKINSIQDILMKGIFDITPETEDSIGNDPIIVKDAWLSGNLLTFEIKYWGKNKIHFINLVKEPGVLTSENEPVILELRHNSNGDPENIPFLSYVTFDLSALKIEGQDSVHFTVTATDYSDNIYSEDGVYTYGEN